MLWGVAHVLDECLLIGRGDGLIEERPDVLHRTVENHFDRVDAARGGELPDSGVGVQDRREDHTHAVEIGWTGFCADAIAEPAAVDGGHEAGPHIGFGEKAALFGFG
jgi:hypothetical protein